MHSTHGAFSETIFIYAHALKLAFAGRAPARVMILGLGLGYIEMVAASVALQSQRQNELLIDSFECEGFLRSQFALWLSSPQELESEAPDFFLAYEDILARCSAHFSLTCAELRLGLALMLSSQRLRLLGSFGLGSDTPSAPYGAILYDAFSSRSTPALWTPQTLNWVCRDLAAAPSVLATYSATGHLKRALLSSGFELKRSEGFGGKRESTLACRLQTGPFDCVRR